MVSDTQTTQEEDVVELTKEGGGVGAINVPGTPSENRWGAAGLDSDSLMISCFDGSEDGEFSNFDVVALEFLY